LFADLPPAVDAARTQDSPEGREEPARKLGKRKDWLQSLDRDLAARRFDDLLRTLREPAVPDAWRDARTSAYEVLACLFTRSAAKAARLARAALEAHGPHLDLHFLLGLALTRDGRVVESAHSFVRAARVSDTEVHHVVTRLADVLGIPILRL
jgi:hypothetical protein